MQDTVMIQRVILCTFAVLPLIYSIGCKNGGVDSKNLELVNTPWRLESFETVEVGTNRILDGRIYSIRFLPDTIAQIRADCNDCMATYHSFAGGSDPQIAVTSLVCTEVYCGQESLDWRFLNGLRNATTYRIQGDILHIYYNEKKEVLNFRAQS
jgi:heat shock protein HslJ